jgi:hypothetical protein
LGYARVNWNKLYIAKCNTCGDSAEPELLYGYDRRWKVLRCIGCGQKSPEYESTSATLEIWNSMQETEHMEETQPSSITNQKFGEVEDFQRQINILIPCACCGREVDYDIAIFRYKDQYYVKCTWCNFSSLSTDTQMSAEIEWNRINQLIARENKAMQETTSTTTMERRQGDRGARERSETVGTGQESSVEITQGSKGEPRVTVKVYHADVAEARRQAIHEYLETITMLQRTLS